jgi:hypothetical protein
MNECRRGQVISPFRNRFAGTRFPSGATFAAGGSRPNRSSSQQPSYIPQPGTSGLQGDSQSSADSGFASQSRGSGHQLGASQLYTRPSVIHRPPDNPLPGPSGMQRLPDNPLPGPSGMQRLPDSPQPGPSGLQRHPDSPLPGPSGMQRHLQQLSSARSALGVGSSNFTGTNLGARYSFFIF